MGMNITQYSGYGFYVPEEDLMKLVDESGDWDLDAEVLYPLVEKYKRLVVEYVGPYDYSEGSGVLVLLKRSHSRADLLAGGSQRMVQPVPTETEIKHLSEAALALFNGDIEGGLYVGPISGTSIG